MSLITRSHLTAAAAGVALTLVAGGGAFLAASQASTHHAGKARIDATTLNGYRSNQLLRTTSIQDPTVLDNFDTSTGGCHFKTTKKVIVNNPGKGYLMVWASVGAARDTDFANPEELVARLKLGTKFSEENATQLTTDGQYDGNVSVQAVFPVPQGKRTVNLQLEACQATSAAYVDSQTVSTLYLPFGSSKFIPSKAKMSANN